MLELILLILGLVGLVVGTELVVRGALNIAKHYKLSPVFIGLTILSIGTDLPELVVDITGAIYRLSGIETSGLIIGETIGTCFGQIALALGIIGLFGTLVLTKRQLIRDGSMMVGSVVLLFLVGLDGMIQWWEGVIFVLIYGFYFFTLFREEKVTEKIRAPGIHPLWSIVSLIGGFAILVYCSKIVIDNALFLAEAWGIAQSFMGVVILGLGTSLPEIAISLGALRKKAYGLSVGNLIGSNIFDILFTLGISSIIAGFNVSRDLLKFDIPALFFVSLVVVGLFAWRKRIKTKEAVVLLLIDLAYIGFKIYSL